MFNLNKTYDTPHGPAVIVEGFDLEVARGEVVSLIGHSGCGKSTVLSMVAGLNEISDGGIVVAGHEIWGPGPDRGVVFQAPCLLPWLSAFDNVMLGVSKVFSHASASERSDIVAHHLCLVGLGNSMSKRPNELSGGMRQRVGIARALALRPKVLLLDEPFGMLDSLTRIELQDLLLEILDRQQITTLLVTHDVDEAIFLSDRVTMMTNGPRARVGDILTIPFERPRARAALLETEEFYRLREHLLSFLESEELERDLVDNATIDTGSCPS
jgi:nitrate ABC transporter ATP-binding subunit